MARRARRPRAARANRQERDERQLRKARGESKPRSTGTGPADSGITDVGQTRPGLPQEGQN